MAERLLKKNTKTVTHACWYVIYLFIHDQLEEIKRKITFFLCFFFLPIFLRFASLQQFLNSENKHGALESEQYGV